MSGPTGQEFMDELELHTAKIWTPRARYYLFDHIEPSSPHMARCVSSELRVVNDGEWIPYRSRLRALPALIHLLQDTYGVTPESLGKAVWFELVRLKSSADAVRKTKQLVGYRDTPETLQMAQNDDDAEAAELAKVVVDTIILANALLGSDVTDEMGRVVVEAGLKHAYVESEGHEAWEHLALGDPVSAIQVLFDDVDMLNFEYGSQSNALKCYAMTGMIEGERSDSSFNEKTNHLRELVSWGGMICDMVTEQRAPLTTFRSLSP